MAEVTIGSNEYRTGKLPPFKQFHIARKLAPVLSALGAGAMAAALDQQEQAAPTGAERDSEQQEESAASALLKIFAPIAGVLADMSEADTEFVLNTCLAVVTRKQGNQYARVLASNGKLMFEDITMPEMIQLAMAVIQENLGSFFPEPSASPSSPGAAS